MMDTVSPFSISEAEVRTLETSEGFRIVRTYLSREQSCSFCPNHSSLSSENQSTFILHRDIIHSLLLPLVQIRSQAAVFASRTLASKHTPRSGSPRRSVVDLELAFRGDARGAFSWLQCFIAEETDWCATRGCAACVVLKVLHAEPFIRIVVASCQLSSYLKKMMGGAQNSNENGGLPNFDFWLATVQRAVSEDEFWGLHFWEDIEARAQDLESGIKHLISQCSTHPSGETAVAVQGRRTKTGSPIWTQGVKNGEMFARQQMILRQEEQEWMSKIITACWATLLAEAARARRGISATKRPVNHRTRSLTT